MYHISQDTTEGEKVTAAPEVDSIHDENGAIAVEILLNPNVLTEFTLSGSQAVSSIYSNMAMVPCHSSLFCFFIADPRMFFFPLFEPLC